MNKLFTYILKLKNVIMRIEVSRSLKIESIIELYQILINKENIIQQSDTLIQFRDYMILYLSGCLCESDINYQKSIDLYHTLNIRVEPRVWEELKSKIQCSKILFFDKNGFDNKFLFEV